MCNLYVTNEFTMQEFKVPEGYLSYQVPGTTTVILYTDTQKICRLDCVGDAKEYFPSEYFPSENPEKLEEYIEKLEAYIKELEEYLRCHVCTLEDFLHEHKLK